MSYLLALPSTVSQSPLHSVDTGGKKENVVDVLGGSQGPDLEVATSFLPMFPWPDLNYKAMFNFKGG